MKTAAQPATFTKSVTKTESGDYITYSAIVRKTETQIVVGPRTLSAHVKNASNRAWRGFGKFFPDFDAMLAGYSSDEMRAFIQSVKADNLPANVIPFQS